MARLLAKLFAYFFWRNTKSRPPEAQLRCCRKRGSPVKPDKRADRGVLPYMLCSKDAARSCSGANRKCCSRPASQAETANAPDESGAFAVCINMRGLRERKRRWESFGMTPAVHCAGGAITAAGGFSLFLLMQQVNADAHNNRKQNRRDHNGSKIFCEPCQHEYHSFVSFDTGRIRPSSSAWLLPYTA